MRYRATSRRERPGAPSWAGAGLWHPSPPQPDTGRVAKGQAAGRGRGGCPHSESQAGRRDTFSSSTPGSPGGMGGRRGDSDPQRNKGLNAGCWPPGESYPQGAGRPGVFRPPPPTLGHGGRGTCTCNIALSLTNRDPQPLLSLLLPTGPGGAGARSAGSHLSGSCPPRRGLSLSIATP